MSDLPAFAALLFALLLSAVSVAAQMALALMSVGAACRLKEKFAPYEWRPFQSPSEVRSEVTPAAAPIGDGREASA